jgi:hypothetical protein
MSSHHPKKIHMMLVRTVFPMVALSVLIAAGGSDVRARGSQAARKLTSALPPKVSNRQVLPLVDGSRQGLRLDARDGDGVAWWPDVQFGNGTIELDIRGKDVLQQSFVGVAFHGVDEKTFDAVYFRPFNFRSDDAARRSHAVQYVSHPTYTWEKLRKEREGQFEHAIAPAPEPNSWFHARVVVTFPSVRVFVNDIAAPVLDIKQLSDRTTGWVGVWVGNGSDGAFANLVVTPAAR